MVIVKDGLAQKIQVGRQLATRHLSASQAVELPHRAPNKRGIGDGGGTP
jgi:hypothetical protein